MSATLPAGRARRAYGRCGGSHRRHRRGSSTSAAVRCEELLAVHSAVAIAASGEERRLEAKGCQELRQLQMARLLWGGAMEASAACCRGRRIGACMWGGLCGLTLCGLQAFSLVLRVDSV